jgi:hypothetical protein
MTYFLNFRTAGVGGPVIDPYLLEGDGTADPPQLAIVQWAQLPRIFDGRKILFATHGFNVSYQAGACSLGLLDGYLDLKWPDLFIGMLWPGDSWIPILDYPFEGNVAIDCGQRLARFCHDWCASAQSLFFASHSLGARFVLEAIMHLDRDVHAVCLTAGAINRNCLDAEYALALDKTAAVSGLASHNDNVLKLAFPIGDPFADLLHDDHTPFQPALGYSGPRTPTPAGVLMPWQIPDAAGYGHGDYLPPHQAVPLPPDAAAKWLRVAAFIRNSFLDQPQKWPET